MQLLSSHIVKVGILLGTLGLNLVLAPTGCSSDPVPSTPGHRGEPGQGPGFVGPNLRAADSNGSESGDDQESGWFGYAALDEGQLPPPDLGLLDTLGLHEAGVEGSLSYDFATHAFMGRVENTTKATLRQVRVVVHLSNGIKLGPTASVNLAPGQAVDITIPAGWQPFTHWSAYLEVG